MPEDLQEEEIIQIPTTDVYYHQLQQPLKVARQSVQIGARVYNSVSVDYAVSVDGSLIEAIDCSETP